MAKNKRIEIGQVVQSLAGREKGALLVAIYSDDCHTTYVDGKRYRFENAKIKNIKHVKIIDAKLLQSEMAKNKSIKTALGRLKI